MIDILAGGPSPIGRKDRADLFLLGPLGPCDNLFLLLTRTYWLLPTHRLCAEVTAWCVERWTSWGVASDL